MKDKLLHTLVGVVCAAVLIFPSAALGYHWGERAGLLAAQTEAMAVPAEEESAALVPETGDTIAIPGFEKIQMEAGTEKQAVSFYNPTENACYFVISLFLPDGKEVYRSGLLSPGKLLDEIELVRPLEAGIYEGAYLRYSCLSVDDMQPLNGADVDFILEVLE